MKKAMTLAGVALLLTGCCYYDYYDGNVRYTQSGTDCIYTSNEGKFRGDRSNESKRIVYRDTICSQLYAQDAQPRPVERVAVNPVASKPVSTCGKPACAQATTCGKPACGKNVSYTDESYVVVRKNTAPATRRFVIIPE